MRSAVRAALSTLRKLDGESIVYQRGEAQAVLDTALKGQASFEVVNSEGEVLTREQGWDWLIGVDELVLDGVPVEPEREDLILETTADRTNVYRLVDLGAAPSWKYSDRGRSQFRIHTKLVEVR